jgi:DNA-binding response OmpR family regulator
MAKKKRILVIEGDGDTAALISTAIGELGHHPTMALDVESGLMGFRPKIFDLVITDIFMAGTGGIDGIIMIRKADENVPIIAVTAGYKNMTAEKTILAAQKIGANYGLVRPFTQNDLVELINQVFEQ